MNGSGAGEVGLQNYMILVVYRLGSEKERECLETCLCKLGEETGGCENYNVICLRVDLNARTEDAW